MILALDVGSKRIGVAVSDPGETFALPVTTIERSNRARDVASIVALAQEYRAKEIVVGDPVTLGGDRGIASQQIDTLVNALVEMFDGTIHRVDERMTTAQATKTLIAADVSRRRRRDVVDRMAAALILETFLARRKNAPQE